MKKGNIFSLGSTATYSQVCKDFDVNGLSVFNGLGPVRELFLGENDSTNEDHEPDAEE